MEIWQFRQSRRVWVAPAEFYRDRRHSVRRQTDVEMDRALLVIPGMRLPRKLGAFLQPFDLTLTQILWRTHLLPEPLRVRMVLVDPFGIRCERRGAARQLVVDMVGFDRVV